MTRRRFSIRWAAGVLCIALASCSSVEENFTIVVLPDTQFYTASMHGATPEMFEAQTRWIVENRADLNIVFVTHLGDLVQNGDRSAEEWGVANRAFSRLEDSEATGLPEGIPYGIAVGNHDQSPEGDPDGTTRFYNRYFGKTRFAGREYYGGSFGSNNDSHYELFASGDYSFVILHLEYDVHADRDVLTWADSIMKKHADRRAIVVTHYLIGSGPDPEFSAQGRALYESLKNNPNLFLMLGGHDGSSGGEARRIDRFNESTVVSLLADYQSRKNGGNGMLRILRFNPTRNEILVRTFSPIINGGLGGFEQDQDSEFVLPFSAIAN